MTQQRFGFRVNAKRAEFRARILLLVVTLLAILIAGCAPAAAPQPEAAPAPTEAAAAEAPAAVNVESADALEAPMLAEQVAAGQLPSLDERLPLEPLVWDFPDANVFETEIGQYGGTLRFGHVFDAVGLATIGLARVAADRSTYYPDVAKEWEWNDDFTSITFFLRPGMKWSDGEPFTARDIEWWYNEIIRSDQLQAPLGVGGMNTNTDTITAVDDYTLQFDFAQPNPLFLLLSRGFAGGEASSWERSAPHYMEKFHPKYTPDPNKEPQAQFQEMLDATSSPRFLEDPARPVLWAWRPLEYQEGQLARLERNPYFWAVDRQGRQLPYIDYVENFLLGDSDEEVIKLKLLAGETDFERRRTSVKDVPLLRENEEKAGIDVIFTIKPEGSQQGIKFNPNHPNPEMRALIEQADFRRALSVAIDRAAINETAYFGLGQPGHGFSNPGEHGAYDDAWAQFDPDQASAMLDAIGLDQRDAEGFRTLPNGDKLTFVLLFRPGWHPGAEETAEIATEGWNAIGLRALAQPLDARALGERRTSGDFEAWIDPWIGGVWDQDLRYGTGVCRWASAACQWWQTKDLPADQQRGEEPPDSVQELLRLEDVIMKTTDEAERQEALTQRREALADSMWVMGMVMDLPHVIVAAKDLRGVWGRNEAMPYFMGAGDEDYWPRSWFFAE